MSTDNYNWVSFNDEIRREMSGLIILVNSAMKEFNGVSILEEYRV